MAEYTVIIPCYNEENTIENAVKEIINKFKELKIDLDVIISEDGSTDRTAEIGKKLAQKYKNVHFIHWSDKRQGKGHSLKNSIKKAKTKYVIQTDCDLSNDINYIDGIIKGLEDGFDIVIGSRFHPDSIVERPLRREIASRAYNRLIRLLFKVNVKDMQCGFKGFLRESVLSVLDDVENTGWFWDTEVIVRMLKKGYKIKEVPTKFVDFRHNTKVNVMRDSRTMGCDAIRLWIKLRKEKRGVNNE